MGLFSQNKVEKLKDQTYADERDKRFDKIHIEEDQLGFSFFHPYWLALIYTGIAFMVILLVVGAFSFALSSVGFLNVENLKNFLGPMSGYYRMLYQHLGFYTLTSIVWFLTQFWVWILFLVSFAGFSIFTLKKQKILAIKFKPELLDNEVDPDDSKLLDDEYLGEIVSRFQVLPDAGAHSKSTDMAGIISHGYLMDKGLKKVAMAQHNEKGEILKDKDGRVIRKKVPIVDAKKGVEILEKGGVHLKDGVPLIDATKMIYGRAKVMKNGKPVKDLKGRQKYKNVTLADEINENWFIPDYEFERPSGFYVIETKPTHTLIISMTRGNKTQLLTANTIDLWRREKQQQSMVVNDPKGEMMLKSQLLLTLAGYDVMPLDLIESDKSVRYNMLQLVIENIRRDDTAEASLELDNLAAVFFPASGSDRFWSDSARAVFKMTAYLMIINHLRQEREMKLMYQRYRQNKRDNTHLQVNSRWSSLIRRPNDFDIPAHSQAELEAKIDRLWGEVTMNGLYQVVSILGRVSSDGVWDDVGPVQDSMSGQLEATNLMKLFRKAIAAQPEDVVVRMFNGENVMLQQVSQSEKTEGTVYGVASVSMKFFAETVIKKLTSVTPSQGLNLLDFSFPRRISLRFSREFMKRYNVSGMQVRAELFKSPQFKASYHVKGKDKDGKPIYAKRDEFMSSDLPVRSQGWVDFWFSGIPKKRNFYLKLTVGGDHPIGEYYFEISKSVMMSADGRYEERNQYDGKRIYKGALIREMARPLTRKECLGLKKRQNLKRGQQIKVPSELFAASMFKSFGKQDDGGQFVLQRDVWDTVRVNYTERPLALFFVTPPSIETYTRLPLTMVNSIFGSNVGQSYIRRASQKPVLRTHFMLEELGNMSADGEGIAGMDRKLSIGLGQGQELTMVLQGFAQMTKVYDKEIQDMTMDNVGVIQYMLSPSKQTLEYISELTGKKTIHKQGGTNYSENIMQVGNKSDGAFSRSQSKEKVPVMSAERLRRLTDGETVAIMPTHRRDNFGETMRSNPVFNTKGTSLPFEFALHEKQASVAAALAVDSLPSMKTPYVLNGINPDLMAPSQTRLMGIIRTNIRAAIYYFLNREMLEDRFLDDDHPANSNELAMAIMEYMGFEIDVNKYLLQNGYMKAGLFSDEELQEAIERGWITQEDVDAVFNPGGDLDQQDGLGMNVHVDSDFSSGEVQGNHLATQEEAAKEDEKVLGKWSIDSFASVLADAYAGKDQALKDTLLDPSAWRDNEFPNVKFSGIGNNFKMINSSGDEILSKEVLFETEMPADLKEGLMGPMAIGLAPSAKNEIDRYLQDQNGDNDFLIDVDDDF